MKKILLTLIFTVLILNPANSEIIDCTTFEKLKEKLDCKAKNLKTKLNEGQKKAKNKIENFDESETKKKFDETKLGKTLKKLKNSKTGSEFMKKE